MGSWTDSSHREISTIFLFQKASWLWHDISCHSKHSACLLLMLYKKYSKSLWKSDMFLYRLHSVTYASLTSFWLPCNICFPHLLPSIKVVYMPILLLSNTHVYCNVFLKLTYFLFEYWKLNPMSLVLICTSLFFQDDAQSLCHAMVQELSI